MKFLFLMVSIVFCLNSWGQVPPQIRICNTSGSTFWSYKVSDPVHDEFGTCHFNDNSALGSISMILFMFEKKQTMAVKALFKTLSTDILSCEKVGALEVEGVDSNDRVVNLCLFDDTSVLMKETLVLGLQNPANIELKNILLD